jgi:Concanavalin A-like lectin/glucanases superfamily/Bacterial Ig domain
MPPGATRNRWRLPTRLGVAGSFLAVMALAVLPAAGSGSPARAAQHPAGVEIRHGPHVEPRTFRGDVRSLPRPKRNVKRKFGPPDESPAGFVKPAPTDSALPVEEPQAAVPSPAVSFKGLDEATWGAGWPPDTVGDVGPNLYVQAVNTSIGIFTKTGTRLAAFTFDSLWAGAATGTACDNSNGGDPTVVYDPMGDRWIVADLGFTDETTPPFYECIAVSRTSDPAAGGWYLYPIRMDDAAHPFFPDYPKMGIWPDGLYLTANMFQGAAFQEVAGWAFNRTDLESGAPVRWVAFDMNSPLHFSLLPSNMRGAPPPSGRENLLVGESLLFYAYEVFKFHPDYDGSGSYVTGPTNVSQTSYTAAPATVPSPGNSLDALGERLMMQAQYVDIGGTESLWVNHTVSTSASGPAGIQWAQINVTGGTIGTAPVQQQIYGNVGGDGLHRWLGSLAVDRNGDMSLGYSVSSSSVNPDIRYAGRLATDPPNTLPQGETTMLPGVTRGTQAGNCGGSACARWGDYSAMTIDPDGCRFWYTNEYYETTGLNWQTRIGSFTFPQCSPTDTTPPTASAGSASTDAGVSVPITLHGSDPEVCELTFSIVAAPSHGALGPIADTACAAGSPNSDTASATYTPTVGFSGADSFTYKVNDGTFDSNIATVSITINATSYDQAVLADSPAAYWRLGESSGTAAADASGNANGGSYTGGVTLGAQPLIDDANTSAGFDGADDRMNFSDSTSLSPTTALSMEAWVRPSAVPTASGSGWHLLSKWNTALLYLRGGPSPKFVFALYDIASSSYSWTVASSTTATAAATYHVVGTYDGANLRIYVNGTLQGTFAHSGLLNDSIYGGALAGGGWGTRPTPSYQGRLDEAALYPTALSSTEVTNHYNVGIAP